MNLHDMYCPHDACRGGYIRSAVFDTNRWVPTDYICKWVPSEKLQARLWQEAMA